MARRGENIYLRKDGRYEGRYIKRRGADGSIRWGYVYGRQYQQVKQQLILLKSQYQGERQTLSQHGRGYLSDWLDYWLEILIKPYVKVSTYYGYRRIVDTYLIANLGDITMEKLESKEIQVFVDKLASRLSESTVRGICRLLRSALREAVDRNLLIRSPYYGIREPKIRSKEARILSRREQKKMEKECINTGQLEYLLCLYTGVRLGELCGLTWADVNFGENLINIRRSVQRIPRRHDGKKTHLLHETPKSARSQREIPMPRFLMKALWEKKTKNSFNEGEPLFQSNSHKGLDPRTIQVRFGKLCQKLRIRGVHMHTLRHTYATRCLEQGVGYETVCALLGHSSPDITMRYYAHCTLETKRKSVKKLEKLAG